VTVQFLIDARGEVGHVRVIQSVPMLDQAAIETVRQWRFTPAVKKGRAVPTLATAPITFKIF
jgi:protein TonB